MKNKLWNWYTDKFVFVEEPIARRLLIVIYFLGVLIIFGGIFLVLEILTLPPEKVKEMKQRINKESVIRLNKKIYQFRIEKTSSSYPEGTMIIKYGQSENIYQLENLSFTAESNTYECLPDKTFYGIEVKDLSKLLNNGNRFRNTVRYDTLTFLLFTVDDMKQFFQYLKVIKSSGFKGVIVVNEGTVYLYLNRPNT